MPKSFKERLEQLGHIVSKCKLGPAWNEHWWCVRCKYVYYNTTGIDDTKQIGCTMVEYKQKPENRDIQDTWEEEHSVYSVYGSTRRITVGHISCDEAIIMQVLK